MRAVGKASRSARSSKQTNDSRTGQLEEMAPSLRKDSSIVLTSLGKYREVPRMVFGGEYAELGSEANIQQLTGLFLRQKPLYWS